MEQAFISKQALIDLLRRIDFSGVPYPVHAASDIPDDTQQFFQLIFENLAKALKNETQGSSPQQYSPALQSQPKSSASPSKKPRSLSTRRTYSFFSVGEKLRSPWAEMSPKCWPNLIKPRATD
jgi:hypothetical protein